MTCTGCQSVRGWSSRQLCWSTSVSTVWHHHTWRHSARRRLIVLAVLVLPSADLYYLHIGDQSFSVKGPVVWNSLPVDLQTRDMSLDAFKWELKTLLLKTVC